MFKNDESPLSLFSFQDIITCLTGIMLFFLLLLSIRIMEITKLFEQQSPYRSEIAEWQRRNELLRQQLRDVENDIHSYRRRIAGIRHEDRATLTLAKFRLERESSELQADMKRLREHHAVRSEAKKKEEAREKTLERQRAELQNAEDRANAVRQQNLAYEESIRKLREEIRKRKHSVYVRVTGKTGKAPIVLVCSRDNIRIVELARKKEVVVPRRGPFFSEMVNEVCRRIGDYPRQNHYFALLIKPSAAGYLPYLLQTISDSCPGIELGNEPILESEDCSL